MRSWWRGRTYWQRFCLMELALVPWARPLLWSVMYQIEGKGAAVTEFEWGGITAFVLIRLMDLAKPVEWR